MIGRRVFVVSSWYLWPGLQDAEADRFFDGWGCGTFLRSQLAEHMYRGHSKQLSVLQGTWTSCFIERLHLCQRALLVVGLSGFTILLWAKEDNSIYLS